MISRVAAARVCDLSLPLIGQLFPPLGKSPAVPEITVDEYYDFLGTKNEIGPPGQLPNVTLPTQPA